MGGHTWNIPKVCPRAYRPGSGTGGFFVRRMINGVDAAQAKQIVAECNVRLHSYGLRFDFGEGGKCGEYSIGIRAVETEGRSPLPMRRYTENMLRGLDGFENWVMDTAKEDAFRRHAKQYGYFPDNQTPELLFI